MQDKFLHKPFFNYWKSYKQYSGNKKSNVRIFGNTNVVRHPIWRQRNSLTHRKTSPTLPHAIFSTWQGTQALTQNQPCQELKMPTHNQPTPAEGILFNFKQRVNNHINAYEQTSFSTCLPLNNEKILRNRLHLNFLTSLHEHT
jgi:hypothetical protein